MIRLVNVFGFLRLVLSWKREGEGQTVGKLVVIDQVLTLWVRLLQGSRVRVLFLCMVWP